MSDDTTAAITPNAAKGTPTSGGTESGPEPKAGAEHPKKPATTLTAAVSDRISQGGAALVNQDVVTPEVVIDPKIAVLRARVVALLTGSGDQRMSSTNYVNVMSAKFMTPTLLNQGANLLWQATKIVIENPYPEVIDAMWDFHVQYRDTLMSQTHGLRGIQSLQASANLKTSIVHSLFNTHAGVPWAARKTAPRVDATQIVTILGDDRLYSYIINKRDSAAK